MRSLLDTLITLRKDVTFLYHSYHLGVCLASPACERSSKHVSTGRLGGFRGVFSGDYRPVMVSWIRDFASPILSEEVRAGDRLQQGTDRGGSGEKSYSIRNHGEDKDNHGRAGKWYKKRAGRVFPKDQEFGAERERKLVSMQLDLAKMELLGKKITELQESFCKKPTEGGGEEEGEEEGLELQEQDYSY